MSYHMKQVKNQLKKLEHRVRHRTMIPFLIILPSLSSFRQDKQDFSLNFLANINVKL